jgi:hypothetical protein
MTDFNSWYNFENPQLAPELRRAYNAGAASERETLRDKFAGKALALAIASGTAPEWEKTIASWTYLMADAMLEARKTSKEKTNV